MMLRAAVLVLAAACATTTTQAPAPAPAAPRDGDRIAQVAIWRPKPGQQAAFEEGYRRHLEWHRRAGDPWSWHGWYVVSGPRDGLFIDATLDRTWADFDAAVQPAEDAADNARNVEPFADFQVAYRVAQLAELGLGTASGIGARFTKLVTLEVIDPPAAIRVLAEARDRLARAGVTQLLVLRVVDGGDLGQLQLWIGAADQAAYGRTSHLFDELRAIERALGTTAFGTMTAERLAYRPELSQIVPRAR